MVDSAVLASIKAGEESTPFVVLKQKADLSLARSRHSHAAKAKTAFEALRTEADSSQRSLRSVLDEEKAGYRPFWIANVLMMTSGDAKQIEEAMKAFSVR